MPDPTSLSNMRDIVEPVGVPWWPPAPGIVLLGVLILLWAVFAGRLWWQSWQRNAYRRAALQELAIIEKKIHHPQTRTEGVRRLSVLLKRVAHAAYPRSVVASLTGDRWHAFLDRQTGGDKFKNVYGKVLMIALHDPNPGEALAAADCRNLVQGVRRWISGHRAAGNISDTAGTGA